MIKFLAQNNMALSYGEKVITLLNLIGESGIERQKLKQEIKKNECIGFWYTNNEGELKCVEDGAINISITETIWWKLITVEGSKCKLTEFGKDSRQGNSFNKRNFEGVLSDILYSKTSDWYDNIDQDKAFDLEGFLEKMGGFPQNTIPTTHRIWTLLKANDDLIFTDDRLNKQRFSQLLSMLSKSCNTLKQLRVPFYLNSKDERIKGLTDS